MLQMHYKISVFKVFSNFGRFGRFGGLKQKKTAGKLTALLTLQGIF